jgi:hypothetical protein
MAVPSLLLLGSLVSPLAAADPAPWNMVFTFHTRHESHPLKYIDVVSAHEWLGNTDARYAMKGNGTEPITALRVADVKKEGRASVTWDLLNHPAEAGLTFGLAVRVEVGKTQQDFFESNVSGSIGVKVKNKAGEEVATLDYAGDSYEASKWWRSVVANDLIATLVGGSTLEPTKTKHNAGGHIVIVLTPVVLVEAIIDGPKTGKHNKSLKHYARAYDKDDRNISAICDFGWKRQWGTYWTDANTWGEESLGSGIADGNRRLLSKEWHMGETAEKISKNYFGPQRKSPGSIYVSATLGSVATPTTGQAVVVNKGSITLRTINKSTPSVGPAEPKIIGKFPNNPRTVNGKGNIPAVETTIPLVNKGSYLWDLFDVLRGYKAGIVAAVASNEPGALLFDIATSTIANNLNRKDITYELKAEATPANHTRSVAWQYVIHGTETVTTVNTSETLQYDSPLLEACESGTMTQKAVTPIIHQLVRRDAETLQILNN